MSQSSNTFSDRIHQAFSKKFNFKTAVAMVVFSMIIIVFVFSSLSGSGGKTLGMGVAATVNSEIISLKQFQDQENRVSSYYSQMLGSQFENLIQKKHLQNEALNQLVDNSVAAQTAESEMIFATDSNVRLAVQEMPYFKKDGVFQSDLYKGVLQSNGLTPGDFEKTIRQQVSIQKVRDLFEASAVVTALEKATDADLKQSKINLLYVKISSDLFLSVDKKADANLKSAADKKSLELAQATEAFLAKNSDQKMIEEFLAKNNLKLKETGFFEISNETVPAISSAAVFKAAMTLTKQVPISKTLIKEGDAQYLIILKDLTKDIAKTTEINSKQNEMLDKQKSYSQYQNWLENSKKLYSINKNAELIAN